MQPLIRRKINTTQQQQQQRNNMIPRKRSFSNSLTRPTNICVISVSLRASIQATRKSEGAKCFLRGPGFQSGGAAGLPISLWPGRGYQSSACKCLPRPQTYQMRFIQRKFTNQAALIKRRALNLVAGGTGPSGAGSPRFQGSPGVHGPTYVIQSYSAFCAQSQDRYYKAGIALRVNRWRRRVRRVNFWPQFLLLLICSYQAPQKPPLKPLTAPPPTPLLPPLKISAHSFSKPGGPNLFFIRGKKT